MKEAIVSNGPVVKVVDSPIPEPGPDQVLIQVVVSGSNPKDWKIPFWLNDVANTGDDIAGYIHSVGKNVWEFKKGDRVACFHEMRTPAGSYAEYAIGWSHTTFHLPEKVSFEEAATIPLAAMTAAIGLHLRLGFPQPFTPSSTPSGPLIVYGGASAVGAFAIKLARHASIHPIITVAGRGIPFVETLIDPSKGDKIIDYRQDDEKVVSDLRAALGDAKCYHAFDATSEKGSYTNISKVLEQNAGSKITLVLPGKDYNTIPEGIEQPITNVGAAHTDAKDFAYVWFRYLARGLAEGWFSPHPHEVVKGGLGGVEEALVNLKEGKASAVKYVFRIAETEGAGQDDGSKL